MNSIKSDYVWRRRVHGGIRFQKGAVPFPDCAAIGLEFNAAIKREDKLSLELLTNGIVLDIWDFAKAASTCDKYLVCEILEYNFDITIENELQRCAFSNRVYQKLKFVKEHMRTKRKRWQEQFSLPDAKALMENSKTPFAGNCYSWLQEIPEQSVMSVESIHNGNAPEQSEMRAQSNHNGDANVTNTELLKAVNQKEPIWEMMIQKPGGIKKRISCDLFPACEEIGLHLCVGPKGKPKQKLSKEVLTVGMMIEIAEFVKLLSGNWMQIILDVIEHNFDIDLNENKMLIRQSITKVQAGRSVGITQELRTEFRNEQFTFPVSTTQGCARKRKKIKHTEESAILQTKRPRKPKVRDGFDLSSERFWPNDRFSYMFPLEEDDVEMFSRSKQGEERMMMECSSGITNGPGSAILLEAKPDEEAEVLVSLIKSSDSSQQSTESSGNTGQGHTHPFTKVDVDMHPKSYCAVKEVQTDRQAKIWRRRSAHIQQVISSNSKVFGSYSNCQKVGIDFNVGSGNKRKLDLQLLTNGVLVDFIKFASAMTKTQRSFSLDILGKNFTLGLDSEIHRRNFLSYFSQRSKLLANHSSRSDIDFQQQIFRIPEVYHMVDVTSDSPNILMKKQNGLESLSERFSSQDTTMEYPFCMEIGLDLCAVEERPWNEKLNLSLLTNGVVLEIISFAKVLCGKVWPIVYDVLEHNFRLNLKGGKTHVASRIQMWYAIQKRLKSKRSQSNTGDGSQTWLNKVVQLKVWSKKTLSSRRKQLLPKGFKCGVSMEDKGLRKKSATCELAPAKKTDCNSFPTCKDIGLELDVKVKSEVKVKLDLQVLTRAVMYELHTFVENNCENANYISALYEILEYNFDLSSQSHRRWEFASSIGCQVRLMAKKCTRLLNKKGEYPNRVFELPFVLCWPEQTSEPMICKEEQMEYNIDMNPEGNGDDRDAVHFVREFIPFDIEVELE